MNFAKFLRTPFYTTLPGDCFWGWLVHLVNDLVLQGQDNIRCEFKASACVWEITVIRSDTKQTSKQKQIFNWRIYLIKYDTGK